MASNQRDANFVPNVAGVSSITFTGTVEPAVNPSTHALLTETTTNPLIAGAPKNGQAIIAVTGTAVQLGSNTLTNGVILYAKSTNAAPITVGGAGVTNVVNGSGNGLILEAGAAASWAVLNTNQLYINGTAGDIISFAGS